MKPILVYFGLTLRLFAVEIVVPAENGNSQNAAPFSLDSMRYQQVYSASAFSSLAPVGGGWITALAFRVDRGFPAFPANAQISLSTTMRDVDDLSTVFSENFGTDNQVVVAGNLNFIGSPQNTPLPTVISLTTPFFYNPGIGNLLLDVRMNIGLGLGSGNELVTFGASTSPVDQTSRVYEFDRDAVSGMADSIGLLTGFKITPIPEPGPAALLIAALAAASVFGVRKKRGERTK